MGLRYRKSVKICKGVRVNFSKSGVGLSFGTRGLRYSIGADGRNRISAGIPGTGLYYTTSTKRGNSKQASNSQNKSITVSLENGNKITINPEDVDKYNETVAILFEGHRSCSPSIDWEEIKTSKPPFELGSKGPLEIEAEKKYNELSPGVMGSLFKGSFNKKKETYYENISKAKEEDEENYKSWEHDVDMAKKVLDGDIDTYYDVVSEINPLENLSKLGVDFEIGTDNPNYMEVEFTTNCREIIPNASLSLTSTGKVSLKKLTKTEMYENAQKYVCSYSIKIARELFAALPINIIYLNAVDNNETILSVKFERERFINTDFSSIYVCDFVYSFIHNVKFLKTQGFKEVDRLSINDDLCDTTSKKKNTKLNVDIPFGWYSQNQNFIKPRDDKLFDLLYIAKTTKTPKEEIAAYKKLISYYLEYQKECQSKGVLFEKYFEETHVYANNKKNSMLNSWKKHLDELEENYLDLMEQQKAMEELSPTLKQDIIEIIKNNPGILQKDLVKKFNPLVKQKILDTLWQIQCDGILRKEKVGNSRALFIENNLNH